MAFDLELQRAQRLQQARESVEEGQTVAGIVAVGPSLNWEGATKEAKEKARVAAEMRKLSKQRREYTSAERYGRETSSSPSVHDDDGEGQAAVTLGDYLPRGADPNDHDTDTSEDEVEQVKRRHHIKKKRLLESLKKKGDASDEQEEDESNTQEEEEESEEEDEEEASSTEEEEEEEDDDSDGSGESDDDAEAFEDDAQTRARIAAFEKEALRVSELVTAIYDGSSTFGEVDWGDCSDEPSDGENPSKAKNNKKTKKN